MLDLDSEVVKVKYKGHAYDVRLPSVGEINNYSKELKKKGEEESFDLLVALLEKLGLPSEISMELSQASFEKLIAELIPSKKK